MRQVSPQAFRAMFAQQTGEVFLLCLTLSHSSWPTDIRLVYNSKPITRAAGVFLPYAFQINLPNEEDEKVPEVTLVIDNASNEIVQSIARIEGRIKATLEVVLDSSPDVVEAGPMEFYILDTQFDSIQISSTLGYEDDVLNNAFPAQTFTPANSPGLFQ